MLKFKNFCRICKVDVDLQIANLFSQKKETVTISAINADEQLNDREDTVRPFFFFQGITEQILTDILPHVLIYINKKIQRELGSKTHFSEGLLSRSRDI